MRPTKVLRLVCLASMVLGVGAARGAEGESSRPVRPNILWLTCEDASPNLGCYGDAAAVTPNLDRLARQGVLYTSAFGVASVCTPCRSCLITGMYSTALGSQHLRSQITLPDEVRCFPSYLRRSGYYCTNNVKQDYNFVAPAGSWDESSATAHWRNRRPGQPFFSVFNCMLTHQGQVRTPEARFAKVAGDFLPGERHDPAKVPLPPYYPDTPLVRRDVARFYALVTAMDKWAGRLLRDLEKDGLADDTIVMFYSDHGSGMPRHKRALYDSGIRVPLIVRFPDKYRGLAPSGPGTRVDRLVSFVDFAPTVLSLAGVPVPEHFQGRAFLGKQAGDPRDYVYCFRDRVDEVFEMIRAVRDRRYKYLRNFMPHRPYMPLSEYCEPAAAVQELRRLDREGRLSGAPASYLRKIKPVEELYDLARDPDELQNLAGSPEHGEVLQRMRKAMLAWMLRTRDTGLLPEAEMFQRAGPQPIHVMARSDERFAVERIMAAADLVGRPETTCEKLVTLLGDADSAVRFWAATGLLAPGMDARPAAEALLKAARDPAPDVRFVAAEGLCRLGRDKEALPALIEGLRHSDPRVRLHAAAVLAALGPQVRPAVESMKPLLADAAKDDYSMFTRWAIGHAYRGLGLPLPPLSQ